MHRLVNEKQKQIIIIINAQDFWNALIKLFNKCA